MQPPALTRVDLIGGGLAAACYSTLDPAAVAGHAGAAGKAQEGDEDKTHQREADPRRSRAHVAARLVIRMDFGWIKPACQRLQTGSAARSFFLRWTMTTTGRMMGTSVQGWS